MRLCGCLLVSVCVCLLVCSISNITIKFCLCTAKNFSREINLAARGLNEFLRQLLSLSSLSHMLYIYLFLLAINPIAHLMPSQAVSQLPVSLSGILYFRQIRIKQQLKSLSLSPSLPRTLCSHSLALGAQKLSGKYN